jgi:hypothetical protein
MADRSRPPDPSSTSGDPERWLDDPDAPPSEDELAASARLRDALAAAEAGRAVDHPDLELAGALRAAVDPRPLDDLSHRRLLDRAVPRRRVAAFFVGSGLVAAAASVLLAVNVTTRSASPPPAAAVVSPMAPSRSSEELFAGPFPKEGETSQRIDAIAASRARDLRNNRWARWGVR